MRYALTLSNVCPLPYVIRTLLRICRMIHPHRYIYALWHTCIDEFTDPSGYERYCADDDVTELLEAADDDDAELPAPAADDDVTELLAPAADDDVTELPDTEVDEDDEEATSSV
jgi:hypothetical protein